MTKLIALAGLALYVAQTPLQHDGTDYPVGAPLKLGPEAAQPLLDVRAIAHADENAAQALQVNSGGINGVDELLADLERRDLQLKEARDQVEQLQQTVAELHQAAAELATSHDAELNALRDQLAPLTAANTDLQARLDKASADNAELQAQLDKAKEAAGASTRAAKSK